jgi:hypothetical protein
MSGMITSVLGFEMAAVIGVGGCAVSVVTKKTAARTDRHSITALPFEHDVDNHEYKRESIN